MGNGLTKKGQAEFEKLLNEFQAKMGAVDDAIICLADLLTTKKDITAVISRRFKCRGHPPEAMGNIQSMESDMEREYLSDFFSVLTMMEETTQTHTMITIVSVRNLLHFISQNAKTFEKVTEMKPLQIDLYTDSSVKDPFGKHNHLQELEEAIRIGDRLKRRETFLRQDLSSTKNQLTSTVKENKLLQRHLREVKKDAELQIERLKRDNNQLKQKEEDIEEMILQQNECKSQEQDEREKELQQRVTEFESDNERLKTAYEHIKQKSDAIILNEKGKNVELESTVKKHEDTIKCHEKEIETKKHEITILMLAKEHQDNEIISLKTSFENDKTMLKSKLEMKDNDLKLEQDIKKAMQEKNLTLQTEYDALESKWESQKLQLESLREKVAQMERKKEVKVQLFAQNRAGLISTAEEDLMAMLKRKINSDSTELRCLQCVRASDIQPEVPLLLLCITASRLGTDVQTAVQGLHLDSKTVLVIFHHKDEHALPSQASERVLTGMDFNKLGGIIDMAFLKGRGLYECNLNTVSMIGLSNFITEGPPKAITLQR